MLFYRERHVVSAGDFDKKTLERVFHTAALLKRLYLDLQEISRLASLLVVNGRSFRCRILLDGESTRTSSSFEDAVEFLGGTAKKDLLRFSSRAKGETLRSTARILGPRTDLIVIRADNEIDAAKKMADAIEDYGLDASVINAGDGNKEHPTQMLLDLFTVWERRQDVFTSGNLVYALVGDLADSRTIHSLMLGLSLYGGRIFLVGPEDQNIPHWLSEKLKEQNGYFPVVKVSDPLLIAPLVDVWYFTRLQKNLKTGTVSEAQEKMYAEVYGASAALRGAMKETAIALHPLPHGPEYPEEIDLCDPRFIHFLQADNGFFIRMNLVFILLARTRGLTRNARVETLGPAGKEYVENVLEIAQPPA